MLCLAEEDLGDVLDEVVDLAGRWPNMCTALRLRPHAEGTIARQCFHQVDDCLKAALRSWLCQEYDTVKYGLPTWKKLVEAVAKRAGGNDVALAKEIAEKHIKKVPDVIPTLSVDTDRHSIAYGSLQGTCTVVSCPARRSSPRGATVWVRDYMYCILYELWPHSQPHAQH